MLGKSRSDDSRCRRVVDAEVIESPSQVIIGIQTRNFCDSGFSFPWEQRNSTLVGYPFDVELPLKKPLAERIVLDKENRLPIKVKQPDNGP